jgi:hypothetical protein
MSFLASLIEVLALLFILVAIVGVIKPDTFKDPKTGKAPTRRQIITGGLVAAAISLFVALLIAPDKTPSEPAIEAKPTTTVPTAPDQSNETKKSETAEHKVIPLNLTDARTFAKGTLQIINEAEKSLEDGVRLRDEGGVERFVRKPLHVELEKWSDLGIQHSDDQRQHFGYCRDAAAQLQTLSFSSFRTQTVELMKYLRQDEARYRKIKQQCEDALNKSDDEIKAAIEKEDAELVENLEEETA